MTAQLLGLEDIALTQGLVHPAIADACFVSVLLEGRRVRVEEVGAIFASLLKVRL